MFANYISDNPGTMIELRDGTIIRAYIQFAEDDLEQDCIHTQNWSHCWWMNGRSVTSRDFDMIKIVD